MGGAAGGVGSKATTGLSQALIALMPPHSVYIESQLGGGALMKRKPPAVRSIRIDRDERALEAVGWWHWWTRRSTAVIAVVSSGNTLPQSPKVWFAAAIAAHSVRR